MARAPSEVSIDLALEEPQTEAYLRARVAKALATSEADLPVIALRKRSIDARKGQVRFHLLFELGAEQPSELGTPHPRAVGPSRTVIVGDGPAGLFCAYELARRGLGCTVVDRGKPVQPRRHDLKRVNRMGEVDPDSNYCFGEGGAGTYSDGKLYTRAHKRGSVRDVIEILARHGAPAAILTDARPHIGSNKLPACGQQLARGARSGGDRVSLRRAGRGLDASSKRAARRSGACCSPTAASYRLTRVVLATGHSASDVYEMLERHGVRLEPKAFALGVRIEHPQPLIDRIQYGAAAGHPALPAAAIAWPRPSTSAACSRSACARAASSCRPRRARRLVVNGMSLSRRSSRYANSGLVVAVEPADVVAAGFAGARGGIALQHALERAAFAAGGGGLRAPPRARPTSSRGRGSSSVPGSSYLPGLNAGNVAEVLDACGAAAQRRDCGVRATRVRSPACAAT